MTKRVSVTLRHLSPDGKQASATLAPAELPAVSEKELLSLLRRVAAIAPKVEFPAEPELRIMSEGDQFVVRVRAGQLLLVSWSAAHKGGVSTPESIVAAVMGGDVAPAEEPVATPRPTVTAPAKKVRKPQGTLTVVALGIAIIAVNAFTVWFVTQPRRTLAAKYRVLPPEQGKRVLEDVAGAYETGRESGDRRIEVGRDASMLRIKYGSGGKPKERQSYTVQPADAAGKKALVTNRKSLVIVRDPMSVELYGDTYTRVTQ